MSDAYCGSISDREIFIKSNLIDKFESGDYICADRGFTISDLLEDKGVILNIPPFLRGKSYLSEKEVMETRVIANRRIIIERVIGRAKKMTILKDCSPRFMQVFTKKLVTSELGIPLVKFGIPSISGNDTIGKSLPVVGLCHVCNWLVLLVLSFSSTLPTRYKNIFSYVLLNGFLYVSLIT